LNNLGVSYAALGQFQQASAVFHEALRIDPNKEGTWSNLGALYERHGRINEADFYYREAQRRARRE